MHTGFYEERIEMEKEDGVEYGFDFLEIIDYGITTKGNDLCGNERTYRITGYDFLHGDCDVFGAYINQKFGCPIYQINDDNENLIHCFGRIYDEKNNQHYFIDVRGITSDYSEFLDEFLDWIDEEKSIENTNEYDASKFVIPDNYMRFLDEFFEDYKWYYKDTISILENKILKETEEEIEI